MPPPVEKRAMSRGRQLLIILAGVLVLSSALCHALVWALAIRTSGVDRGRINPQAGGKPALVLGSSLIFFGISFREVATAMDRPLVTRSVGGCSPCELEWLAREVPEAARTLIGVSLFDLNESNLSDARPTLVPFTQTISDLRASHSDWASTKRVVWSYPVPWVQRILPLTGRSNAMMVNLRDKVRSLRKQPAGADLETRLTFKTDEDAERPEKLSNWDRGRIGRTLAQLAATGLPHGRFDGPKSLALGRILASAASQEPAVVIVFPVSPPYREMFADTTSVEHFEQALARIKAANPNVQMIRLDQEPALQPAEVYWDLVHLNDDGRRLATRRLIEQLSPEAAR